MNIPRSIAAGLIAATLPLVAVAPAAVAATSANTPTVAVAAKSKKPPLVKMLLTQKELEERMSWVGEVFIVEKPQKVGKTSSVFLASGVNATGDRASAGTGIDLFGGTKKQFNREAKKLFNSFGITVTGGNPGYSWSGKGTEADSTVYVTILNLGKGFSVTGVVIASASEDELQQGVRALQAENIASGQANKVYKFGYGTLGLFGR